jgi:hypothetical protein
MLNMLTMLTIQAMLIYTHTLLVQGLSRTLQAYLGSFVREGRPIAPPMEPQWPALLQQQPLRGASSTMHRATEDASANATDRPTMQLAMPSRLISDDPNAQVCEFWSYHPPA